MMQNPILTCFSIVFFILALGIALSVLLGWYRLRRRFPDSAEKSLVTLNFVSGRMGFVNLGRGLHLSGCPSGLRIAMVRAFGPLSRPFFIPWAELAVGRDTSIWGDVAILEFGIPPIGTLVIPAQVADQFARKLERSWPETRDVRTGSSPNWFHRARNYFEVFIYWFVSAFLVSVVFALGNLFLAQKLDLNGPELAMAGVAGFVVVLRRHWRRKR